MTPKVREVVDHGRDRPWWRAPIEPPNGAPVVAPRLSPQWAGFTRHLQAYLIEQGGATSKRDFAPLFPAPARSERAEALSAFAPTRGRGGTRSNRLVMRRPHYRCRSIGSA
jgi:hypothetical protein